MKLLGVHIDNKLNFHEHINKICKSAGNQLNALIRLKLFIGFQEKEVLVNSFLYSNFNYCQLENSDNCNKNIRRLRFLCIEKYKTLNNLNPSFTK